MKPTIITLLIILLAALTIWIGGFVSGGAKPEQPQPFAAAKPDPSLGLYEVQFYYRTQPRPWAPSVRYTLSLPMQLRFAQWPGIYDIAEVVKGAPFKEYVICTDCPLRVIELKKPAEKPIPEDKPLKEQL